MSGAVAAHPQRSIAQLQRQLDELAVELRARTAERDAALARETATAEVLQVINSSPGNLTGVRRDLGEGPHALWGRSTAPFWPTTAHAFTQSRDTAGSPRAGEGDRGSGFLPPTDGALWKLTRGDAFAQIVDVAELAAQRSDDPLTRALVEIGGIRTQLGVALRKDETLLGAITANRREVRPFTDKEIALLQNFAARRLSQWKMRGS